jgi:hypothetical protein
MRVEVVEPAKRSGDSSRKPARREREDFIDGIGYAGYCGHLER